MRKILTIITLSLSTMLLAQPDGPVDLSKMNVNNTWFKVGANVALPIGNIASDVDVIAGLDIGLQFLRTEAYGIGVRSGYLKYIGDNSFDVVPLALMFRFYPKESGIFTGVDLGYSFVSGLSGTSGGYLYRPHIGWHTYNWNFFLYYDHTDTEESVDDLQSIGLGVTYNLRFGEK
ncbi:hypothetical protein GYB22_06565 [bacterium]|nr:hypothetical protein [bacterium]